jgi:two-component system chemotaxis response regulator CheB
MAKKDIVVVGGSSGSGEVLKTLLAGLPKDFPASLFITTHVPSNATSHLAHILSGASAIPVVGALHGQPIEPGRAYVAPQDRHLLVIDGAVFLGTGPRENMVRPAIDPMFRSAALSYGPRAIGVVITGMLNDGAAGLAAIAQTGGTTVVQHPLDASAEDMPRAALEVVNADHVARADELAGLLTDLVRTDAGPIQSPSDDLIFEVEVAAGAQVGSKLLRNFATPVALTCPDCHGVLSEMRGVKPLRYRCQVGHAYTAEVLTSQEDQVDEAVRVAMRIMEERVELVSRMARDARETGRLAVAELYDQRAEEYGRYSRTLRDAALASIRMRRAGADDPP